MSDLRQRCQEMLDQLKRNAILRQGSPVDDLMAFVIAEKGRSIDAGLDYTAPLCLYFETEAEREEFITAVMEAKPNMKCKRMPPL